LASTRVAQRKTAKKQHVVGVEGDGWHWALSVKLLEYAGIDCAPNDLAKDVNSEHEQALTEPTPVPNGRAWLTVDERSCAARGEQNCEPFQKSGPETIAAQNLEQERP
jgi:hypothetical protein